MSNRKKFQIKTKQKLRRRKKRFKLLQKGLKPHDFFAAGYYIGPHQVKEALR